jgi:hypothetical protein
MATTKFSIYDLYVIAERKPWSTLCTHDEKVYTSKEEAMAEAKERVETAKSYRGSLTVMTLDDFISEYGSDRYDEGSGDERESASWGDSSY